MKNNRKELKAKLVNEIVPQYKSKINQLELAYNKMRQEYIDEVGKRQKLENQLSELQSELNQYKDWCERLQSFMDMSDEERKLFISNMQMENKAYMLIDRIQKYAQLMF
jgi:chromosome segregation ATPase